MTHQDSRRKFLATAVAGAAVPFLSVALPQKKQPLKRPYTVLFQGDSITDGNRGRSEDPNHILGHGYAFSLAARLGADFPERDLRFINRGVSGDTLASLLQRWEDDALALNPDAISILAGINDVLAIVDGRNPSHSIEKVESSYRKLLQETKKRLPHTTLIIGEPFTLPVGMVKGDKRWPALMKHLRESVHRVASEFKAVHVPFQQAFDEAANKAPASYWIWDGIHPTYAGHEIMARTWLKSVAPHIPEIST